MTPLERYTERNNIRKYTNYFIPVASVIVTLAWNGATIMLSASFGLLKVTIKFSFSSNTVSPNASNCMHASGEVIDRVSVCVMSEKSLPAEESEIIVLKLFYFLLHRCE